MKIKLLIEAENDDFEYVSVRTKDGGISIGKLDKKGRLIYLAGHWIPTSDPDKKDRILRTYVKEIIRDGGRMYRETIAGLNLPPKYKKGGGVQ